MDAQGETNRDEHRDQIHMIGRWIAWLISALTFWAVGIGQAYIVVMAARSGVTPPAAEMSPGTDHQAGKRVSLSSDRSKRRV